jgi:hypothetical protein
VGGPGRRETVAARLMPLGERLRAAGWLQVLRSSWALGALVVVLSWQAIFISPTLGLDGSWNLAMQMAAVERLHWGTDFILNYGPLGFLRSPLVANMWPAILSTLYLFAARLALAVSVVWVARRRFTLPVALVMAFLIVALSVGWVDLTVPLVFVWCVVALTEDSPVLAHRIVTYGGGVVSAVELLVKLNEGLLIIAMCLITAATMGGSRARNLARFGLTFLGSLVALWFAAGQGTSNADDFVRSSIELIRGYSSALGSSGAAWVVVAALITLAAVTAVAWLSGKGLGRARRLGLVLLVLALGFFAWKEGFVRQDVGHMTIFFAWMLAPWIVLPWRWRDPWSVAAFAAVVLLYFGATRSHPVDLLQPLDNAKTMVTDLRTVFDPTRRAEARTEAAASMRASYRLDPRTLSLLAGKTVDVWPWETGIVWAYGLDWKELPVTPNTAVYTSWLDQRNEDALASSGGPQRILRYPTPYRGLAVGPNSGDALSVDGRYAPYDSPAATLAMLCHYTAMRTTAGLQVLGRVPNRCGEPRLLSSASASYGQAVRVPRSPGSHEIVFVRLHGAAPSGIEAVPTLLYRPAHRFVVFDGGATYRVVPSLLGDGLILDAPRASDFPAPFALAPNAHTIAIGKDAAPLSPDRELSFDFYTMRVRLSR